MSDEHAMLLYAQLAAVSEQRRQPLGELRFLMLAGIAAARAGWPEVAERCHTLVTSTAPHHLLAHYESFADALRDDDFTPFVRQLQRFCSLERAEHLLCELGQPVAEAAAGSSAGAMALSVLAGLST